MSAETLKTKLTEAQKEFDAGDYGAAEACLKGLDQSDLKVQLNLAIVRFAKGDIDAEAAIAAIRGAEGSWRHSASAIVLRYEGHETMLYNQALLEARSGHSANAIRLLRNLLEIADDIAVPTLTRCLCLFQTLTQSAASLGACPRSKPDDDLAQKVLTSIMDTVKSDPQLLKMVNASFADSSSLHEYFPNSKDQPAEQGTYLNNLGILFLNDGKAGVASLCFAKAQKCMEKQLSLQSKAVTYNAGLCALLREEYDQAIRFFLDVQEHMQGSPLFWVRFTEAAVGAVELEHRQRQTRVYEKAQTEFSASLNRPQTVSSYDFLQLPGAKLGLGPLGQALEETTEPYAMKLLAANALQNALFLLLPPGATLATCLEGASPQMAPLIQHVVVYWAALELFNENYVTTVEVGSALLQCCRQVAEKEPKYPLPSNLHATLLSYVTEALIHLNDPDRALNILNNASLSSLLKSKVQHDHADVAQRSRIECVFVNLAITHILTGSWLQASNILESLLAKIMESASPAMLEYRPERDALFAYQLLSIFVELAQGNKEKALDIMNKQIVWSV